MHTGIIELCRELLRPTASGAGTYLYGEISYDCRMVVAVAVISEAGGVPRTAPITNAVAAASMPCVPSTVISSTCSVTHSTEL